MWSMGGIAVTSYQLPVTSYELPVYGIRKRVRTFLANYIPPGGLNRLDGCYNNIVY